MPLMEGKKIVKRSTGYTFPKATIPDNFPYPFEAPWFPSDYEGSSKQCSEGTAFNNLIINVDADKNKYAKKWDCKNGLFFCYQSTFEGSTKVTEMWEVLKVHNIEGNTVAERCNEGNRDKVIWHGFGIFRDNVTQNGTFFVADESGINSNYAVKIERNDVVIFSFSDNVIHMKPGETFVEIILNAEKNGFKPTLHTRESAIYQGSKSGRDYIKKKENFRSDLTEMDLSSPYKVFHHFNFDGAFWTIPFDVHNEEDYRAFKVIRTEGCNIDAEIDIRCGDYVWKEVAPAAYNRTLANGTTLTTYEVMYGYHHYDMKYRYYKEYDWNYFENSKEISLKMGNDFPNYTYVPVAKNEKKFLQITSQDYHKKLMALFVDCHFAQVIYKFRQYDPNMVVGNGNAIDPMVDWSKDYEPINGCVQKLLSLSDDIDMEEREKPLDYMETTHDVQFFIGIKPKEGVENKWSMSVEQFKNFERFIDSNDSYWYGQWLFPSDKSYGSYKYYDLKAKFRAADKDLRKALGVPEVTDGNVIATLGVYQEIYECPTVTFYLPRVFGRLDIVMMDKKGSRVFSYEYAHTNENLKDFVNPIEFYELKGKKCTPGSNQRDISKLCDW